MNNRHRDLIRDYLDDRISAEDLARLNQLLETDAEIRARFRAMATLEEGLCDLAAIPEQARSPSLPSRRPFSTWAGLAAAACVVFAIGMAVARYFRDEPAPSPQIAYVHELEGSAWLEGSQLAEGSEVSLGVVRVGSGSITLRFNNGTTLLIDGPSELSIDTEIQVSLKHGKVAARVPEEAYGFTVFGPDSAVIDLGTEFAMVVEVALYPSALSAEEIAEHYQLMQVR